MTILPDTPPVGTALSVAAAIRFLKRNGWAQPDANTLIRIKEAK
jgi:hypothetical protein